MFWLQWPSIYVRFILQNKGALPADLIGTRKYARIVRFVLVQLEWARK